VQLNVNITDGPTDVEMKLLFTPHPRKQIHRHRRDSRRNPSAQIWKKFHPFAVHDVFDVLAEEEVDHC
jgi:hypothetical protein